MTTSDDKAAASCPPPLAFEQILVEEGAGPSSGEWAAHIATCASCAAQLERARAAGDAYMASADAQHLRERLSALPSTQKRVRYGIVVWLAPLVAALACASLLLARRSGPPAPWQSKGTGVLSLTVLRAGRTFSWQGDPLQSGDAVQLAWSSPRDGYLAVFAHQKGGQIDLLFPETGQGGAPVKHGGPLRLGGTILMSRDLDRMHLVTVFSATRFDFQPWLDRLRQDDERLPPEATRLELTVEDSIP